LEVKTRENTVRVVNELVLRVDTAFEHVDEGLVEHVWFLPG